MLPGGGDLMMSGQSSRGGTGSKKGVFPSPWVASLSFLGSPSLAWLGTCWAKQHNKNNGRKRSRMGTEHSTSSCWRTRMLTWCRWCVSPRSCPRGKQPAVLPSCAADWCTWSGWSGPQRTLIKHKGHPTNDLQHRTGVFPQDKITGFDKVHG